MKVKEVFEFAESITDTDTSIGIFAALAVMITLLDQSSARQDLLSRFSAWQQERANKKSE